MPGLVVGRKSKRIPLMLGLRSPGGMCRGLISTVLAVGFGSLAGCGTAPESASLAPVASISGAISGTAGAAVIFSAAGSSDPQGQPLSYAWNFGDSTTGTGVSTTHTYSAAGVYIVTLKVTDSSGLAGTATSQATISAAANTSARNGVVYGGQQPVSGATVQLWQVGTTGYGTGASALGTSATTGSDGSFSITGNYSCANAANGGNTLVYLTATGGNPGLGQGTNNSAIYLMAAMGTCGSLSPSTYVILNEVTTVASVYALSQFMSPSGGIGSFGSSNQGLINAFATVNNLVSIANGSALATTPNGNGVVPQAELDTLADILSTCVNSASPSSPTCSSLFTSTTPGGGPAPATMLAAALNIAQNPANNVPALLGMPTAQSPFQPTISSANDLTVAIGYASGGSSAKALALDSTGNVWVANYGTGGASSSVSMMTPLGVPATNSPFSGATYVNGASAIAIDTNNNVWLANHDNSSATELSASLTGSSYSIATVNGPFNAIGLNSPSAVGVDPANNIWFANNGNNSVIELPNAGCSTQSCVTSFTGGGLNAPSGIALDSSGVAWVTNTSGASVTKIDPSTTPASFTGGGLTNPAGVAIDGSSNVWVTDSTLAQVSKLNGLGTAVSPSSGYTGGGVTGSTADAIDGGGDVWAADASGNRISELNSSGTVVTPATGYQGGSLSAPAALAIDASGDVWVADGSPVANITVTEFVGLAPPAIMPLAQAVKTATIGQAPGTPAIQKAPLANAGGQYAGMAGSAVTFNGLGSTDPKQETLLYAWNFGDGSGGSGPTPAHSYFSAGPYTVTLTVTNTDGLPSAASSTSAAIAALPALTPVANAGGPYNGTAYTAIGFTGTGSSDPNNPTAGALALSFAWNFGDGSQGAGPAPVHTYATAGTYTVSLTVMSPAGTSATAATSAVVAAGTAPTGAPTAAAGGPYSGTANSAIAFSSAGSSDPNSLALSYFWQFGDGASSTAASPTHTYASSGNYSVTLTASNGTTWTTASTSAAITAVTPAALVANAGGPYTVAVNQPLIFDGTRSTNPSGRQLNYLWDFGDGTTSTGAKPSHTYSQQRSYTVNLNVTDGLTGNGNASTQATVTPPPAEAITPAAGGPYQDETGHGIVFDASSSGDNLDNSLSYSWNFGDGTTGTGATPTHSYTTVGTYTATVTVSSSTASAMASANVAISANIGVMVTSPTANSIFSANTVTVGGTVSAPNLTVSVNGIAASVSGTSFTATGVSLREGVNLISATATDGHGGVGSGVVSVILDVTAPTVSITAPASGATVTTSAVAVAGLVNDIVTGTIGSNDVTITVNGLPAQVSNRSYLLSNLQLAPGQNTITVVATDKVGNQSQTSEAVQLLPASSQLSLVKLSGDNQTAAVQTVLPQALVVQLVAASGTPVTGRPVTFTVTRSDGMVEVMPTTAQSLSVNTDGSGKASVLFQLGSRTGLGINQVSATTPGAAGAVVFTETSTIGAPTQIHLVNGENQRGLLGEPLAQAFQVLVQDALGNPVPGVTVNYTSAGASDGSIDTPNPVTDNNGKAIATLTLGQQEGLSNYVVKADFTGDTGSPVVFIASAYAPGPVANTSVSGVVLDNSNTPVPNATVTIQGTTLSTVTNASGNFTINGAPVGTVTLTVDGSTAATTETLPFLSFVLQDLPGQNNTLGKPIFLPAIDVNDAQTVGGNDPVTLTMAGVPGLAFTVAPNSVTFPDGTTVGKLSLSQVKSDMVPMEPSNGTGPNLLWTLQPAGTKFSVPIQVTLPNTQGLPPGYVTELYQYDHDLEQFVSAGTGHVSADGSVIMSDPGFGITKAGWGHGGSPPPPPICTVSCGQSSNPCVSLAAYNCGCTPVYNNGAVCGLPTNPASCTAQGVCLKGLCQGGPKPDGSKCNDGIFCKQPETCMAGVCTGTPIPPLPDPNNLSESLGLNSFSQAFTSIANPVALFGEKYALGFQVKPMLAITQATNTLICCEALKMLNVPQDSLSITAGLTIGAGPIGIPGLSIYIPTVGYSGFTASIGGSFTGTATHNTSICDAQNCWTGTITLSATITGALTANLPLGFSASVTLSGGVTGSLVINCASIDGSISTLPIAAGGSITTPFGFPITVPALTFVPSIVLGSGSTPFY
jgi:PKD repeat protein